MIEGAARRHGALRFRATGADMAKKGKKYRAAAEKSTRLKQYAH